MKIALALNLMVFLDAANAREIVFIMAHMHLVRGVSFRV